MNKRNIKPDLETILYEFVDSNKQPTYDVIQEWVNRYPEFEKELVEFAVSWSLSEKLPPNPEVAKIDEETLVLRGMSVVQNLLNNSGFSNLNESVPISNLIEEAKTQGLSLHDLAERCRLSVALITKLHRRLIIFGTIPNEVLYSLAEALKRKTVDFEQYLCSVSVPATVKFRTSSRPQSSQQQDFFEAIRTDSQISNENKQYWLTLLAKGKNK